MNYRHAFHAGNFADLVKHAALLQLLADLAQRGDPITVIDTHAGRGVYELHGAEARKSGEAADGVLRLLAAEAPAVFDPLVRAVAALNGGRDVRLYPGSPWLIAQALRPSDRYVACELRGEEHQALATAMGGRRNVRALKVDGYPAAVAEAPATGRVLALIDPPFEQPDDYARTCATLAALRRRNPQAQALVWLPLKDLETFDAFLRDLEETVAAPMLVAETRMRPLSDPMRMNGCGLVLAGASDLAPRLETICGWVAHTLGDPGGEARIYRLAPQ